MPESRIEPPFICLGIPAGAVLDSPCPDCGHRIGAHAIVMETDGAGTCDVCAIIRAVTSAR